MTKIEPVGYIYTQHNLSSGAITDHAIPNGTALYTSFQMRRAMEACAAVCNDADKSTHPSDLADAIRNLIKEMLG